MPTKDEFTTELRARFRRAQERDAEFIDINSGELHRALGGHPAAKHQMPSCCKPRTRDLVQGRDSRVVEDARAWFLAHLYKRRALA